MAQQYPPPAQQQGGRGPGGRGPYQQYPYPPGGGGGRGGGGGGGGPRPPTTTTVGAWQPVQPTSSSLQQQAAAGAGQPGQQQPKPGVVPPGQPYPATSSLQQAAAGQQQQPQQRPMPQQGGYPPAAYYNPYAQQQAAAQQYNPYARQGPYGGPQGVYYPPPQAQQQQAAQHAPPPKREKKPLVITDKAGNVIDFSSSVKKPKPVTPEPAAAAAASTAADATPVLAPYSAPAETEEAGAKLRQAALAAMGKKDEAKALLEKAKKEAEEKAAKKEAEEKAKKEAEEKARLEAEERAKKEAEEKARLEAEEKAKKEAEEKARLEAEEKAKKEAEEKAKKEAEQEAKAKSSLAAMLQRPKPAPVVSEGSDRRLYTKEILLRFKKAPECSERPADLPDMTIVRGPPEQAGGGGRGGGRRDSKSGTWQRGSQQQAPRRQSSRGDRGVGPAGEEQWSRGQAPPPQRQQKGGRGVGGGKGRYQQPPLFDGPVAPLVKSENHWRPQKNTSPLIVAEKKVKAILNKMTKEKFDLLSSQMLEIPILSYETLTMMIDNVFEKAIDEPAFGDMYADLCVRLSQSVQGNNFVHIIESDEEPPTENGEEPAEGESSSHTVYRWSNDVGTSDDEIVGPLPSPEACIDAAMDEEERTPTERGDVELELVSALIKSGVFIKIMKKKGAEEGEQDSYYAVYFPVHEAEECGQQLSEIFLSQVECVSDGMKKNSFKRSLLNKCEEEFNKQDIYVDWKKEKKEYEESKSKLTDAERAEKEEDLSFRRIRIKKQMLGNVKFIGQLYKKGMLKEKIMRYCISSLLKLKETGEIKNKNPEYEDTGDMDMDEEDHEAICSMFATIGSTIDRPPAADFMDLCFTKILQLSTDKTLPSRSRFMYKDLLDLRVNNWVPRRKEEKAKTIAEIRKDVEKEERRQAQQSVQQQRGGGGHRREGSFRDRGGRPDYGSGRQQSQRSRQPKPTTQTDEDGFTVIASKSAFSTPKSPAKSQPRTTSTAAPKSSMFGALADEHAAPTATAKPKRAALSEEDLERRIKSMRSDFLTDGGNVDEVLLSWDEISGTRDAGSKLVSQNADRIMDCKDSERRAIYKIITILSEKGKLSKDDVRNGLMEAIEFIDSLAMDAPRAYEYLGELLADALRIKMIDIAWLCEQLEKTKMVSETKAPEKVIRFTLQALRKTAGSLSYEAAVDEKQLTGLLGADAWNALSKEL